MAADFNARLKSNMSTFLAKQQGQSISMGERREGGAHGSRSFTAWASLSVKEQRERRLKVTRSAPSSPVKKARKSKKDRYVARRKARKAAAGASSRRELTFANAS